MTLGIFLNGKLLGVMTFGVGPFYGFKLVNNATPDDVVTLTRLWSPDELPSNSESKILGVALRSLKRDTSLKFVLAYSDPVFGHFGTIYQATNWLYTGFHLQHRFTISEMECCIIPGVMAHQLGTHSIRYLTSARNQCPDNSASSKTSIYLLSGSFLDVTVGGARAAISKKEVDMNGNS